MSSEELRLFDKVRVYLDEDYSSAENFTVGINYHNVPIKLPFMCVCVCARVYVYVCVCALVHTQVPGHMCMHALECVLTFYGSTCFVHRAAVTCHVENDCLKDDQKMIAKC